MCVVGNVISSLSKQFWKFRTFLCSNFAIKFDIERLFDDSLKKCRIRLYAKVKLNHIMLKMSPIHQNN